MLAMAQALKSRGHRPLVAAPANFETWVRSLGFDFAVLGADMQAFLADNPEILTSKPLKMGHHSLAFFKTHAPMQAEQLLAICKGADALLYAGLAVFFAPTVAQALGIAAMHVQFTTCVLPSAAYPPVAFPWHGLPAWVNKVLWWINARVSNRAMLPTLNALRSRISQIQSPERALSPVVNIWDHILNCYPLVIAADAQVLPPDRNWRGRYLYANFLYFDDPRPLDADLEAWLNAGEPPVYIGFGSMAGAATSRIEGLLVQALVGSGRRVLIGAGWAALAVHSALPPGWRVVADAPHALLFQRVAVVVHHGGSGTTAQALRAGAAQVVLPLILDQFHQAHRLHVQGLTPRPVFMEKVTARQLRQSVETAITMPPGPRMEVAQRLRQTNAATDIAVRLEDWVHRYRNI
jgi:vancomycin aglycone glucosyltransferase